MACRPLVAGLLLVAVTASAADEAPRFTLVNRSPFTAVLGVPTGWTQPGRPAAELAWDIANHAVGQQSGGEQLLLDGETHVVTLRLRHPLGERWSFGVEAPWIAHGGGFLDRAIDAWHDAFGLHEGVRPELPTGDLRYVYAAGGTEVFALDDYASGPGDLHTTAAYRVLARGWTLDVLADVEWPTGDADKLTGSGGTDVSASLRATGPALARLTWSVAAGVTWPGDVDLPLPPASAQIPWYDASLGWAALESLDLVLQVQGQGGAYRSGLEMLGSSALQFGAGVVWRVNGGLGIRFGVFEDIHTDTAPDFATELAVTVSPSGDPRGRH